MIHVIGILFLFCCAFVNSAKVFEEIRSGTCTDENGRENIEDAATCEEAATMLGLRPTQEMKYEGATSKPAGCYIYIHNGPYLVFNSRLDSEAGSNQYFWNICTVTLPACTNTDGSAPNSDDPCICGNMVCRDTASRYCYESESRCSQFANAKFTFIERTSGVCGDSIVEFPVGDLGLTRGLKECEEGATALGWPFTTAVGVIDNYLPYGCILHTGYGHLYFNRYTTTKTCQTYAKCMCPVAGPVCTNTDGSARNSGNTCLCGTVACDATTGLYCDASKNHCDKMAGPYSDAYFIVTSGTCAYNGYGYIEDAATCEEAAEQLGFSDTSAVDDGQYQKTFDPPGCYFEDGRLKISVDDVNTAVDDRNTGDCSNSDQCLCKRMLPTCPHHDGATANPAACVCGASGACTSATGLFCDTSNNDRCSQFATCSNTDGIMANTADCACGTADCDATSLYCVASKSLCSPSPICSNTDGSTGNSADCACGTANCDGTTGLFCFADDNRCRFATCSNTDGSTANSADCACGTEDCDATTGLYCDASKNHCDKMAGPYSDAYFIVTSGTCASNGYGYIEDAAACEAAAGQVGWSDTTAGTSSWTSYPRGCWDTSSSTSGGGLIFNTNTASTESCDYSSSQACLCAFTAAVCPHHDGATANPGPCICGASGGCTSATGFFCDTSNNDRCSQFATCSNTDGSTANSADCACGTTDCDGTTGFFCFADENRCDFVPCVNTNGMVVNSKTCTCGNADCKDEKLFCDTSNNDRCSSTHKCANTNGMVVNEDNCACGTADCTTDTGLFCDKSKSHCDNFPYCANTNGSTVNSADCTCGPAVCDASSGRFCYAPENLCMDFAHPRRIGKFVTSGKCTDYGYDVITNVETCTWTARVMGRRALHLSPAESVSSSTRPYGCYEPSWGGLVFNPNTGTSGSCESYPSAGCLCTVTGPACPHDDGTTDNAGSVTYNVGWCKCGNKVCTSNSHGQCTGMVCTAASNTCSRPQACTNTDGSAVNSAACACGAVDCAGGDYCWESHSRCAQIPRCAVTDGSAPNSAECACVTIDCKGGEYCLYGTEDWLTQWGICKESSVGPLC